jgi:hypothetical protein
MFWHVVPQRQPLPASSLLTHQCCGNCFALCCRALLVDEVLYEPSRLLRKNRKAVLLITGMRSTARQGKGVVLHRC